MIDRVEATRYTIQGIHHHAGTTKQKTPRTLRVYMYSVFGLRDQDYSTNMTI